ncbi:hypothetical protein ACFLTE_11845, partial [Bacteroidota bacterium]
MSYSQCTFICPPDSTFYTKPGSTTFISDTLMPYVNGTCGSSELSFTLTGATVKTGDTIINDTFNLGLTKAVYSKDGNVCNFNVLVQDLEPPEIIGYDNISTSANPGDCGAQVNYDLPSISDNTENITSIVQAFDFNIDSKEELTGIGWEFNGIDVYSDDTCLRTNVLSTSGAHTVTTSFYQFENTDSVFFTHWTSDPSGDDTDSLFVYLINSSNDTTSIFEYACIDTNIKHID